MLTHFLPSLPVGKETGRRKERAERLALSADIYIVSHHGKKDLAARLDIARRFHGDAGMR